MAAAAHPDDIEFLMSGTLMLLGKAGYELHYMNIANGSCGTVKLDADEIVRIRTEEARAAARYIGAVFHPPLVNDLEIFYEQALIRKLCAVLRQVNPQILLLPSPQDYMEDHMNASRVMVTAAFCRNMRNYATIPDTPPVDSEMAIYHAMPVGLRDQLRNPVQPHLFVDVSSVMREKVAMLSHHRSQRQWLDESQGHDDYLAFMETMARQVGDLSGRFQFAEGWRRHLHLGFGSEDFDPLREALVEYVAPGQTE